MKRRMIPVWVWLGLAAILANVAIVFLLLPSISGRLTPFYNQSRFMDGYDEIALNLATGHGYRFNPETAETLMREPGYPLILAVLYRVFGTSFLVPELANLVLVLATIGVLVHLCRRFSDRPAVWVTAVILFVLHPGILLAESRGGVEILLTFLLTLFLLTLFRALEINRVRDYLLCGCVLGLTVLVKSTAMLFPAVLLPFLLLFGNPKRSRLSTCWNMGALVLAMCVMLSPWVARNYALTGRVVPTASVLGISAHAGQYICSHLQENKPWYLLDREASWERSRLAREQGFRFEDGYYQLFYNSADELKFSGFLAQRVLARYESEPALCVKCMSYNLLNFWCAGKTSVSRTVNGLFQFPYLLLAGAGIVLCMRSGRSEYAGIVLLFILYSAAVCVPILAQARYSVPLAPFICSFTGVALVALWRRKMPDPAREDFTAGRRSASTTIFGSAHTMGATGRPDVVEEARNNLSRIGGIAELQPSPREEVDLSIVIPAYNEQARLPRTVLETMLWCTAHRMNFELLIADDGSHDETPTLARLFEESDRRIRFLRCPHGGKGAAVRMGMLNARGRHVLFMDADGATSLDEIPKLMRALEDGYDVAIGSRVVPQGGEVEVKTSLHRKLIGRTFAFFVGQFALKGIRDTQCGFKMFRRAAVAEIFCRQQMTGFAFDVEVLYLARRLSLSIAELPVNWVAQPGSKVNLVTDSLKMLWDIARIRWLQRRLSIPHSGTQAEQAVSRSVLSS